MGSLSDAIWFWAASPGSHHLITSLQKCSLWHFTLKNALICQNWSGNLNLGINNSVAIGQVKRCCPTKRPKRLPGFCRRLRNWKIVDRMSHQLNTNRYDTSSAVWSPLQKLHPDSSLVEFDGTFKISGYHGNEQWNGWSRWRWAGLVERCSPSVTFQVNLMENRRIWGNSFFCGNSSYISLLS